MTAHRSTTQRSAGRRLFCRSVGRLGPAALADPLPAVGGTGDPGGGGRVRAARTINPVLAPTTSTPPRNNPIATQSRNDSLAPTSMSATTPREPSAFIRTTDQSPSRTFHVTVCVPTPDAETAQKRCSVGGDCGAPPAIGRYFTRKGSKSMSWTLAWATLPRYLATAGSGPMPMKRILAPGLSPRIRTLPNQLSLGASPVPHHRSRVACVSGRRSTTQTARSASSGSRPRVACDRPRAGSLPLPERRARTGPRRCREL